MRIFLYLLASLLLCSLFFSLFPIFTSLLNTPFFLLVLFFFFFFSFSLFAFSFLLYLPPDFFGISIDYYMQKNVRNSLREEDKNKNLKEAKINTNYN